MRPSPGRPQLRLAARSSPIFDLTRSRALPGWDGERGVQPIGSAAEGGLPRRDHGQRLQLQGVHGAPQGRLLPPALRRQRPEAPQAPRHAALRRVPPLCVVTHRFAMEF